MVAPGRPGEIAKKVSASIALATLDDLFGKPRYWDLATLDNGLGEPRRWAWRAEIMALSYLHDGFGEHR